MASGGLRPLLTQPGLTGSVAWVQLVRQHNSTLRDDRGAHLRASPPRALLTSHRGVRPALAPRGNVPISPATLGGSAYEGGDGASGEESCAGVGGPRDAARM